MADQSKDKSIHEGKKKAGSSTDTCARDTTTLSSFPAVATLFAEPKVIAHLNALPQKQLSEEFLKCCGSTQWVANMVKQRPYTSFSKERSGKLTIGEACDAAFDVLSETSWNLPRFSAT